MQRRLAHIGDQSKGKGKQKDVHDDVKKTNEFDEEIEAADAAEMQDKPLTHLLRKGKEGGEIVGKEDLWACLFGRNRSGEEDSPFDLEKAISDHADKLYGLSGDEGAEV